MPLSQTLLFAQTFPKARSKATSTTAKNVLGPLQSRLRPASTSAQLPYHQCPSEVQPLPFPKTPYKDAPTIVKMARQSAAAAGGLDPGLGTRNERKQLRLETTKQSQEPNRV